jgi:hypothetical protein
MAVNKWGKTIDCAVIHGKYVVKNPAAKRLTGRTFFILYRGLRAGLGLLLKKNLKKTLKVFLRFAEKL